jgi:hypothetical protein
MVDFLIVQIKLKKISIEQIPERFKEEVIKKLEVHM